jgi:DNA-directed RNA polymerase specialized sigma24 family protein
MIGGITTASISAERKRNRDTRFFRQAMNRMNRNRYLGQLDRLVVKEAMESLPEPYRQLIRDLYWNGLSTVEVAEKYGLPHWRVAKDRRLALDRIIQFWQESEEEFG